MNGQASAKRSIGKLDNFPEFPAEVTLGPHAETYFVLREKSGGADSYVYRLASAVCPHAGGYVQAFNGELVCPLHFWAFDSETGESTNMIGETLECQPLELIDGELFIKD